MERAAYTQAVEGSQEREQFEKLLLRQSTAATAGVRARLRRSLLIGLQASTLLAGALGGAALGAIAHAGALTICLATVPYALAWLLLVNISSVYLESGDARPWTSTLPAMGRTTFIALLISWPTAAALDLAGARHPALAAVLAATVAAVASIGGAGIVQAFVYRSHRRQRTVILGSGSVASHVVERLEHAAHLSLELIGLLDDDVHTELSPQMPWLGRLEDLESVVRKHEVDRVIVAFTRSGHHELLRCIRICWDNDVAIDIVPRLFEFLDGARTVDRVGGLPMLSVTAPRLSPPARALKRATDIVLSLLGLLILSPLLLGVALLIRLDSPGIAFFRQKRVGRDGREFLIFKYRSMYLDADARKQEYLELNEASDGVMFKIRDDPRITRIGRFLRRLSIDELPQLINVLRGDMSLIGPRPLIPEEAAAFSQHWHERRLALRPGLTGLWQIYGRSSIPFQDMLRFDYQYVANWSLRRDIEIMLMTVPVMLSARGAY